MGHDRRRWSCSGVLSAGGRRCSTCPHFVGGHAWLEHWLEPVLEPGARGWCRSRCREGPTEYGSDRRSRSLIGVVGLVVGLAGHAAAGRSLRRPAGAAPRPGSRGCSADKYYVDELYDALIVRPLQWLVAHGAVAGRRPGLVDGVGVNGQRRPARRARLARAAGSRPGRSGVYLVVFVVGVRVGAAASCCS